MLTYLKKITSLDNLDSKPQGQIATFLILMMVVVLIFIISTVNIGQVSVKSTMVKNAAESTGLALASNLASRSHIYAQSLFDSCKNYSQCCVTTTILDTILAIVAAIVAVILAAPSGGTSMLVWATLAGTAGGAIGGGLGTGTWQGAGAGAIKGFAIGLAIGAMAGAVPVGPSAAPTAASGVASELTIAKVGGTIMFFPAGEVVPAGAIISSGLVYVPASFAAIAAEIGMSALASIYLATEAMKMKGEGFKAIANITQGLPLDEQVKESAYFQALSGVVDDPADVKDEDDSDQDDNYSEKVSRFQAMWFKRVKKVQEKYYGLLDLLGELRDLMYKYYAQKMIENDIDAKNPSLLSFLSEGGWLLQLSEGGWLLQLGEFFPSIEGWDEEKQRSVTIYPLTVEAEYFTEELKRFSTDTDSLRNRTSTNKLIQEHKSLLRVYYDDDYEDRSDYDHYDILRAFIWGGEEGLLNYDAPLDKDKYHPYIGMKGWKGHLISKRNNLSECEYVSWQEDLKDKDGNVVKDKDGNPVKVTKYDYNTFDNPPCKISVPEKHTENPRYSEYNFDYAGSINPDTVDEIGRVIEYLIRYGSDTYVATGAADAGRILQNIDSPALPTDFKYLPGLIAWYAKKIKKTAEDVSKEPISIAGSGAAITETFTPSNDNPQDVEIGYSWLDSLCKSESDLCHTVQMQMKNPAKFKMAEIVYTEKHKGFLGTSTEHCNKLVSGSGEVWIKITRQDNDEKNLGLLGRWKATSISKEITAKYDSGNVSLAD